MRKMANNIHNSFNIMILTMFSVLLLTGCAGMGTTGSKYMNQRIFTTKHDIKIQKATEIAIQAFQDMEVVLSKKNMASGFISGVLTTGWWVNKETYFLEVYISIPDAKHVKIHATSTAGPQTAFTNELDDIVEDFYAAYKKNLDRI